MRSDRSGSTPGKDEAKAALELLRRLKPHAPGAQAVVWDMILRGRHIHTILAEIGLVPVVGVHAKRKEEGTKGRRAGAYDPKTVDLDDVPVGMADGTDRVVHLAARDGQVCLKAITETGDPHYEPLAVVRVQRHPNKHGYRWYGQYRVPEEYGGEAITVRYHQTEEDDRRSLNRTENLRPVPEGSEDYARLIRLRPDAESSNRGIEDSLYINRASAKGWRRQMVDLLGYARLVNAITLARCRAREPASAAA
ncbi:MAG: hypothetical protein HY658_11930 [Actinobacteria bacterium]|nr:hypothetical protein [Actinomycetota bacterium]